MQKPRSLIPACQREQKVFILLDVETNISPKLECSILSSGSQSVACFLSRTFQKRDHYFSGSKSGQAKRNKNEIKMIRSRFSNSKISKTASLTFCIKAAIKNFLLEEDKSIEKTCSLRWNSAFANTAKSANNFGRRDKKTHISHYLLV